MEARFIKGKNGLEIVLENPTLEEQPILDAFVMSQNSLTPAKSKFAIDFTRRGNKIRTLAISRKIYLTSALFRSLNYQVISGGKNDHCWIKYTEGDKFVLLIGNGGYRVYFHKLNYYRQNVPGGYVDIGRMVLFYNESTNEYRIEDRYGEFDSILFRTVDVVYTANTLADIVRYKQFEMKPNSV